MFRTAIPFRHDTAQTITHRHKLLAVGSCFAENIGTYLKNAKFDICINPFGTQYNPLSIAEGIRSLKKDTYFGENDIFEYEGVWHSFQHHSEFSNIDKQVCLEGINQALELAKNTLQSANMLLVTLGTAWVYELAENNKIVSNCHKLPAQRFHRKRLSVAEIMDTLENMLLNLTNDRPDLKIVFTVSPIRHIKDGFVENQISKSSLILAVHQIIEKWQNVSYFPAYEIMMDDLRDYRFYASDMIHPSDTAIQYIWECFSKIYFPHDTQDLIHKIAKLTKNIQHRPFNSQSAAHQLFLKKTWTEIVQMEKEYPYLSWEIEKQAIRTQIIENNLIV